MVAPTDFDYDYIVIGSGFGGSVSALRLAEKGYKVLVIEKGKWLTAKDFPATNWNLKKWLWLPALRFFGLFKLTYFRHVAILSGVGVVAALWFTPIPCRFQRRNSSKLIRGRIWRIGKRLKPFYQTALTMLGATSIRDWKWATWH
jgi:cholesterol oxidase